MNIYKTPRFLPLLFPGLLWRVKTSSAVVYLTFDDGPMPGPTDFVLDQLAAHRAHATFFCIGDNIRKHPETFQRIRREGHLPANHTFNHLSGWGTGTRRYHENIQQCDDVLMNQPDEPRLFRPPYGRLNPAHRSNHRVVMWDLLSCDYDPALDPQQSLQALKTGTGPGSIVVFHDSLKAEKNLRYLLPRYLEFLSSAGYRMETLPSGV
ncbi:MAG: polysaccharide deacetylase family protein [Bacteroidota bacterium]